MRVRGCIDDSRVGRPAITDSGCEVFRRLNAVRRERLGELVAEWPPEQRERVAAVLRNLARALVPDTAAR